MERTFEVLFCGKIVGYVWAVSRHEARREARSLFPEYGHLKVVEVC